MLRRMGVKQSPFPFGMAEWFARDAGCIVSADLSAPTTFFDCTFINCNIENAIVYNSELTSCKFNKATVTGSQFLDDGNFGNLTVNGDLTIGSRGTLTIGESSALKEQTLEMMKDIGKATSELMKDFGTPPLTPRKSKRKAKLPKKLEKGWV